MYIYQIYNRRNCQVSFLTVLGAGSPRSGASAVGFSAQHPVFSHGGKWASSLPASSYKGTNTIHKCPTIATSLPTKAAPQVTGLGIDGTVRGHLDLDLQTMGSHRKFCNRKMASALYLIAAMHFEMRRTLCTCINCSTVMHSFHLLLWVFCHLLVCEPVLILSAYRTLATFVSNLLLKFCLYPTKS